MDTIMPRQSVTIDAALTREIDQRTDAESGAHHLSRSAAITRDLSRAYVLLRMELPALREMFSREEQFAIASACNGWASRMEPAEMLLGELYQGSEQTNTMAAQVEDAIRYDQLDQDMEIDGPALVAKLRSLTPAARWALIDAVERWWINPRRDETPIL